MKRTQYAKFSASTMAGDVNIYIAKQAGCADSDLRSDAYTVMITEFGRVAKLRPGFELVKTIPTDAYTNRKYLSNNVQWAYVARAN